MVALLARHAHDQRQPGRLAVAHDLAHGVEAETGMLHVEHGEVGARRLQDLADAGRGELEQEGADFGRGRPDQRRADCLLALCFPLAAPMLALPVPD